MRVSDARFHGFFGTHWHHFAKGNRLDIRWKHPNPLCWDRIEGRRQEDRWGIEKAAHVCSSPINAHIAIQRPSQGASLARALDLPPEGHRWHDDDDADLEHATSCLSRTGRPTPARGASVHLEGQFLGAPPRPRGH